MTSMGNFSRCLPPLGGRGMSRTPSPTETGKRKLTAGVGVPDDPSGKNDLDGQFFPLPAAPGRQGDVEDAIPYGETGRFF